MLILPHIFRRYRPPPESSATAHISPMVGLLVGLQIRQNSALLNGEGTHLRSGKRRGTAGLVIRLIDYLVA